MHYLYRVDYRRRDDPRGTPHRLTVTATTAQDARRAARAEDPLFGSTITSPRRMREVRRLCFVCALTDGTDRAAGHDGQHGALVS